MDQHELEGVWAKVLRSLRENQNFALFGLLATMNDVEFHDNEILIHLHNDSEKAMLKQHLTELQTLVGPEITVKTQDDTQIVYDENRDYIARLKDLFGDQVEIM